MRSALSILFSPLFFGRWFRLSQVDVNLPSSTRFIKYLSLSDCMSRKVLVYPRINLGPWHKNISISTRNRQVKWDKNLEINKEIGLVIVSTKYQLKHTSIVRHYMEFGLFEYFSTEEQHHVWRLLTALRFIID